MCEGSEINIIPIPIERYRFRNLWHAKRARYLHTKGNSNLHSQKNEYAGFLNWRKYLCSVTTTCAYRACLCGRLFTKFHNREALIWMEFIH